MNSLEIKTQPNRDRREPPKSNFSIWMIVGFLGFLTLINSAEANKPFLADAYTKLVDQTLIVPPHESADLAKGAVEAFRDKEIMSGTFNESLEQVSLKIRQGAVETLVYKDGEPYLATGDLINQYVDLDNYVHFTLLSNIHAVIGDSQDIRISSRHDTMITTATCLPYDYVSQDFSSIDAEEPVRDLVLCDLNTHMHSQDIPVSIKPIDLSLFTPNAELIPGETYTSYGFSVNASETPEKADDDEHLPLAATFTYSHTAAGYPYFNNVTPFGPGGSGGVMTRNGRIVGIMTGYRPWSQTSSVEYKITDNYDGPFAWFTEPIPDDFVETVTAFQNGIMENQITNWTTIPPLKHNALLPE